MPPDAPTRCSWAAGDPLTGIVRHRGKIEATISNDLRARG